MRRLLFCLAFALTMPPTALVAEGAPIRCSDWTKLGDHTWRVKKEVMLATALRQGQVLRDTPETKALDAKCASRPPS